MLKIVGSLIVAAGFVQAFAQDDVKVDINLRGAELLDATRVLTAKSGIQIVFEPSKEPYQKINIQLKDKSADEALKYICMAAGAEVRKDNDVYVVSHVKQPGEKTVTAPAKAVKLNSRRLTLINADAKDVADQLLGRDIDTYRAWRQIKQYDSASKTLTGPRYETGVQDTHFPVSEQAYQNYTRPTQGKDGGGNDVAQGTEQSNQFGGGGGFGGGGQNGGGFGGGQNGGGGFGGQNGGGGFGGQNGGINNGRGLIPQDIDYFMYDPNDNSIVVRGTEEAIAELQTQISRFDVAPRQVLVKVEFITTSSSLDKAIGYDVNYERANTFFGTIAGSFARSADPIFLTYSTGNVTLRLRALLNSGTGKTVNSPIIRTLNNQPATLQDTTTTTEYTSTVTSNSAGNVTSFTATQITIATGITVSPRINGDDTITMALSPQVSGFGQERIAPDGTTSTRDILTQQIRCIARVHDGETIVLGGLNTKDDTEQIKRYPILGDLPIVGQFFRSSVITKSHSELLIFVTPTIIRDDENGGLSP